MLCQLSVLGGGNATNVPSKIEVMVGVLQPYLELLFAQISGGSLTLKCLQFLNSFRNIASVISRLNGLLRFTYHPVGL